VNGECRIARCARPQGKQPAPRDSFRGRISRAQPWAIRGGIMLWLTDGRSTTIRRTSNENSNRHTTSFPRRIRRITACVTRLRQSPASCLSGQLHDLDSRGRETLRGVIVHQHGCGEGSCKSGLTGAYDLHWQALARKHDCALLAPAYEQPERPTARCGATRGTVPPPRSKSAWSTWARSRAIPNWPRCRGRCGDTAAAVTGRAEWYCCIPSASPPRGCGPACRYCNLTRRGRDQGRTPCPTPH
jgi:hypothetical protein